MGRCDILLRLWVPSGRLAGPIWKPFICFLAGRAASPSWVRLEDMVLGVCTGMDSGTGGCLCVAAGKKKGGLGACNR